MRRLQEPDLYARDPKQAAALARQRAHAASELALAEEDWLAASAALEQEFSDRVGNPTDY